MSTGLNATLEFLSRTENRAALDILIAAVDCPYRRSRDEALSAIMERREPEGHREVFRRLPKMREHCRSIVQNYSGRLVRVVNTALKDPAVQPPTAACEVILSFHLYGAMHGLVSILAEPSDPTTRLAAQTVLRLVKRFYVELRSSDEQAQCGDLDTHRRRITSNLEEAIRKFHRHRQTEIIEAFLMVAKQQNSALRQILQNQDEASHAVIMDILSNSPNGGVIRLLLSFLEDRKVPRLITNVISNRCDVKFVKNLLRTIGPKASKSLAESLSRLDSLAWAEPGNELLDGLEGELQHAFVELLTASSIDRNKKLELVAHLLVHGKPDGRRAAAEALARFAGPEADNLTVQGLNDEDPFVKAHLLRQLRPRKIRDSLSLLVRMIDTTDNVVRQALREAMPEFSFRHFMVVFDSLPEGLRLVGGYMVKQIDPETKDLLAAEMRTLSPVRRRRAVQAAAAMGLVQEMECDVVPLVSDEDHMVRAVAAGALAECGTMMTWEALRDALIDRSFIVQEAAEQSLQRISESLQKSAAEEADQQQTEEVTL